MKILLAAPEDRTVLGQITGHCASALSALGADVRIFDFRRHPYARSGITALLKKAVRAVLPKAPSVYEVPLVKAASDKKTNEELLRLAAAYRPDLLLVFCGENISPQTIGVIRQRGVVTANWFHDSVLYSSRRDLVLRTLPSYDHLFLIDDMAVFNSSEYHRSVGVALPRARTLCLGLNPEVHRRRPLTPEDQKRFGADVAFVGTVSQNRLSVLEALSDFDLAIWGSWQKPSDLLRGAYREQFISAQDAAKIYNASKIVIDIHALFGKTSQIFNVTPRIFEVPGCGGFLLANDLPQARSLYEAQKEMVFYKDTDDLRRLIRYYLDHDEERSRVASAGYDAAQEKYTYRARCRELLAVAMGGR